jgi:hypothetical protein
MSSHLGLVCVILANGRPVSPPNKYPIPFSVPFGAYLAHVTGVVPTQSLSGSRSSCDDTSRCPATHCQVHCEWSCEVPGNSAARPPCPRSRSRRANGHRYDSGRSVATCNRRGGCRVVGQHGEKCPLLGDCRRSCRMNRHVG